VCALLHSTPTVECLEGLNTPTVVCIEHLNIHISAHNMSQHSNTYISEADGAHSCAYTGQVERDGEASQSGDGYLASRLVENSQCSLSARWARVTQPASRDRTGHRATDGQSGGH
jgi:hypothetical protein